MSVGRRRHVVVEVATTAKYDSRKLATMVGLGDKRSEKLLRQVRVAQPEALECRARVRIAMDYLRALETR